jgi:hypothetical protein
MRGMRLIAAALIGSAGVVVAALMLPRDGDGGSG